MSIFKETFRKFVRHQLQIREGVVSLGNDGKGRINNTKDIKLNGGKDVTLPLGAFYTNTTNRQCTIRMSSGVDLKSNNELIKDNSNPFERKDDLVNEVL